MNMMVSAAAIAAATPALAATTSPDQELIDLAQDLMDRLPELQAATLKSDEAWHAFEARKPARNDVLKWRPGDDVGYYWEDLPDGKRLLWCNPIDIAALRGVRQYDWSLPEENEAAFFALPEEHQLRNLGVPHERVQHLFFKTPSALKQNRLNKLLAALDEHTAACEALKDELGCHEAAARAEQLIGPVWEIAERMEAIEATSLAGLQAKAKVLLYWYWGGETDIEDTQAAEIVKGLVNARLAA